MFMVQWNFAKGLGRKFVSLFLVSVLLVSCGDKQNDVDVIVQGLADEAGNVDPYEAGKAVGLASDTSAAYNEANAEGTARGEADGFNETYQGAFDTAEAEGQVDGDTQGYADGELEGQLTIPDFANGYTQGDADGYNAAYTPAYNSGYDTGYDQGFDRGDTAGYNDGYDDSYTPAYNQAYNNALNSSNSSDFSNRGEGYDDGYDDGYDQGYNDDYDWGYNSAYSGGYDDGYDDGYDIGDSDGYSDGLADSDYYYSVSSSSKDLEKIGSEQEKKLWLGMAFKLKTQFGLSVERARSVSHLALNWKKMSAKRAMTDNDSNLFYKKAFGFTQDQLHHAIQKQAEGEELAYDNLIDKAAEFNGTSSESIQNFLVQYK